MAKRTLLVVALLMIASIAWLAARDAEPKLPPSVAASPAQPEHAPDPTSLELDSLAAGRSNAAREVASRVERAESSTTATLAMLAVSRHTRAPLARVRVRAWSDGSAGFETTAQVDRQTARLGEAPISAADGRVELELPVGVEVKVTSHREDDPTSRTVDIVEPLAPGERRELTIELPTDADLRYFGRVIARDDKRPIAGAKIELVRGKPWISGSKMGEGEVVLATTESDAEGRFELSIPFWKQPDLRVRARGFGVAIVQVAANHTSPETASDVQLARGAAVRARLLDVHGAPLSDGAVRIWTDVERLAVADNRPIYFPLVGDVEWTARADVEGLCEISELAPDVPLYVEISSGGRARRADVTSFSLSPGEVRTVEWRLDSGCRLHGIVVDQHGSPVADRELWMQRADRDQPKHFQKNEDDVVHKTKTDESGRFVIGDVLHGRWWLGPAADRTNWDPVDESGIAPVGQVVEIDAGVVERELRLVVHRGLFIRGSVLDPSGEPMSEGFLYAMREESKFVTSARTDSEGTFAIGPLAPGRYELVAFGGPSANSTPVDANAGDVGIELRLRTAGTMRITTVDALTGAACKARVTCALKELQGVPQSGMSADNGELRLDGLTPGIYDVTAWSEQRIGLARDIRVREGEETSNVIVTLEPGAGLRMKYAGKDRQLNFRIRDAESIVAWGTIESGGSTSIAVPTGRLDVHCETSGGTIQSNTVHLKVGEEIELKLGGM